MYIYIYTCVCMYIYRYMYIYITIVQLQLINIIIVQLLLIVTEGYRKNTRTLPTTTETDAVQVTSNLFLTSRTYDFTAPFQRRCFIIYIYIYIYIYIVCLFLRFLFDGADSMQTQIKVRLKLGRCSTGVETEYVSLRSKCSNLYYRFFRFFWIRYALCKFLT